MSEKVTAREAIASKNLKSLWWVVCLRLNNHHQVFIQTLYINRFNYDIMDSSIYLLWKDGSPTRKTTEVAEEEKSKMELSGGAGVA